ncbi:MAG: hypothetical protein QHH05_04935 [Syntrophomonadaceae bacterium]|nr:hypothetical protein [Syntrophomonadaceae bacterium]
MGGRGRKAGVLLAIIALLAWPSAATAAVVRWQLECRADGSVTETISGDDARVAALRCGLDDGWRASQPGGRMQLERVTPDIDTYNQRGERLPLVCASRNWLLWRQWSVAWDGAMSSQLLEDLTEGGSQLVVVLVLPGRGASGLRAQEGVTKEWQLASVRDAERVTLASRQYSVMGMVGVPLAAALAFSVALMVRQVRRTHALIESLEYDEQEKEG